MGYPPNVSADFTKTLNNAANDGRMYSVTTANFAVTTNNAYAAISLFWTARATKIIVMSAKAQNATSALVHRLHRTTTDPALSGVSIAGLAIRSMVLNQPASTANLTSATEAVANTTGTMYRSLYTNQNTAAELLQKQEDYIILPPGVAGGVLLLLNGVSTNAVSGELIWTEI